MHIQEIVCEQMNRACQREENQVRGYLQENKAYHLSFLIGAIIALIIAGVFADGAGYSLVPWVLGAFFVGEIVRFIAWRIEQKEE